MYSGMHPISCVQCSGSITHESIENTEIYSKGPRVYIVCTSRNHGGTWQWFRCVIDSIELTASLCGVALIHYHVASHMCCLPALVGLQCCNETLCVSTVEGLSFQSVNNSLGPPSTTINNTEWYWSLFPPCCVTLTYVASPHTYSMYLSLACKKWACALTRPAERYSLWSEP